MYNLRQAYPNELYHHGIKGQKWGVRRYQNPDGTLTAAGKKRYNTGELSKVSVKKPYDIEKKGGRKGLRVSAKYYSEEDYSNLNKKERKALKKTEKGRNAFATRQYKKELSSEEYIKSRDKALKNTKGIKNKLKVVNEYEQKAAIKAVNDASKISMDQAMNEYNKAMKSAAIKAGVGVGSYAALMYVAMPGTKANTALTNVYFRNAQTKNTDRMVYDIADELVRKR